MVHSLEFVSAPKEGLFDSHFREEMTQQSSRNRTGAFKACADEVSQRNGSIGRRTDYSGKGRLDFSSRRMRGSSCNRGVVRVILSTLSTP